MGLVEWLGTRSQSGCLEFDQELPSSSPDTNILKKLSRPAIYPAMDPSVTNNDQSLVESFEKIPWETKKKKQRRDFPPPCLYYYTLALIRKSFILFYKLKKFHKTQTLVLNNRHPNKWNDPGMTNSYSRVCVSFSNE